MGLRETSPRTGFLLAGGKSSRMGVDKAFLPFRGRPLVEHTLTIMRQVCSPVTVVGDPATYARYGQVVSDIFPGSGPLAGIHAGLLSTSSNLNLFLAVDMPFVSAPLLTFLFSVAEESDAIVVAPRTARGLQPLCGIYHRSFAGIAEKALRAGMFKIDAAFAGLKVHVVEEAELARAGFSEQDFFNVNTPADLDQALGSGKPA
jgi:molybdopterin-guanine dinucleotide biosynthesis protein A